eukprot:1535044-Pyramimonas_sp.AAC.1
MVRAIEYDITEFCESCVALCAQLTDTDPATYPAAGAPFGPDLIDFEDCKAAQEGGNTPQQRGP